ncbi:MAG: 30S ribosomal protein S6 [Candidatus Komeilibacteria bacterium]|nr:30S ribosomal protein S6 [Candidatus Komeilibacteria bacterium]
MEKPYELCVLFAGTATPTEIDELAKQIETMLAGAAADIKFNHSLGRKKLAYQIKGNSHGEYRSWLFLADSGTIPALNEKLRLSSFILRFLLATLDKGVLEKRIQKIQDIKAGKTKEMIDDETRISETPPTPAPITVEEEKVEPEKIETPEETASTPVKEKTKLSLDDLDKKLDEILDSDTL